MAKKRGQHGRAVPGLADRQPRTDSGARWRTAAIVMMSIGLLALTGLACVLSYPSLHALAEQSAVSPTQAKIYPMIFDAMLVITGSAVLALRGARLFSRIYAWLSLLVLLAALAGGGVVRAGGFAVSRQPAAIAAAAIPWALVLIGFGLLVTLLGYARQRRSGGQGAQAVQVRPKAAQPEADDETLSTEAADGANSHEPGGSAHDSDITASPAASAGGTRRKTSARPADLQLRARVPASRTPPASETMPHEITTPSGTTAPASAIPLGRHAAVDTDATPPDSAIPPASPAPPSVRTPPPPTSPADTTPPGRPADTTPPTSPADTAPPHPTSPPSSPAPSPASPTPPPVRPADTAPPHPTIPPSSPAPADTTPPGGALPPASSAAEETSETVPSRVRPYIVSSAIDEGSADLLPNSEAVADADAQSPPAGLAGPARVTELAKPAEPALPAYSPAESPEFRRPHSSPTPPDD